MFSNIFWNAGSQYLILVMAALGALVCFVSVGSSQEKKTFMQHVRALRLVAGAQRAVWFCVNAFAAWSINLAIKLLVDRPRPFEVDPSTVASQLLVYTPSFPSGHAATAFAIATFVFLQNRKAGLLFFPLAIWVGLSRYFVGVHYLSDVVAGAFVGVVVSLALHRLLKRFFS